MKSVSLQNPAVVRHSSCH